MSETLRRMIFPQSSISRRSSMAVGPEAAKSSIPKSQVSVTVTDPLPAAGAPQRKVCDTLANHYVDPIGPIQDYLVIVRSS